MVKRFESGAPSAPPPPPSEPHIPHDGAREDAFGIVEAVVDIRRRVLAVAERIASARAAGDTSADSTPVAGHLVDALLAVGGRPADRRCHPLRWVLDAACAPTRATADPDGTMAAKGVIDAVCDAMAFGHAHPEGEAELRRVADVWPRHGSKASADQAMERLAREDVERRQAHEKREHEKRLAKAHARATAPQPVPGSTAPFVRAERPAHPADGVTPDDMGPRVS